jgi:carbamoyl-phosphate synthase large subunit
MRILLTGAGSLVARGIHDALAGRGSGVELIGANMDPRDPTALLCSRVHPLPPDSQPAALREGIASVAAAEKPDLVIPCRDPHIGILAELQDAGELTGKAPLGPAALARIMVDKWEAHNWCIPRQIPFAPSVLAGQQDTMEAIDRLIAAHGLPLIAKPRAGSGSLGVRVIHDWGQAERASQISGLVFQPFLDPPPDSSLRIDMSIGTPLFWEAPGTRNFGGQFLIGPGGELGPGMQVYASQRLGRNESCGQGHDEALQAIMTRATALFAAAGWRGPLTIQARPHHGQWYITEFGGRFGGGTSQRRWLGLDEVGWIVNAWAGRAVVPPPDGPPATFVARHLADTPVWQTPAGASLFPHPRS